MLERTSIRQEKEREKAISKKLSEMVTDIEYIPPIECSKQCILNYGEKSEERLRQKKRESTIFAVQYLKESQIPHSPKELEEKYFDETSEGVLVIKLTIKKKLETKVDFNNLYKLVTADRAAADLNQQLLQTLNSSIQPAAQLQVQKPMPIVNNTNASKKYSSVDEMPKPPNYKTVPCRLYHSSVGCTRGEFCHFVHNPQFAGREIPVSDAPKKKRMMMPGYNGMVPYYMNGPPPPEMMYPPPMHEYATMYGGPPPQYYMRPPPQFNNADYDKKQ